MTRIASRRTTAGTAKSGSPRPRFIEPAGARSKNLLVALLPIVFSLSAGSNMFFDIVLSEDVFKLHRRVSLLVAVLNDDRHVDAQPELFAFAFGDCSRAWYHDSSGRNLERSIRRFPI